MTVDRRQPQVFLKPVSFFWKTPICDTLDVYGFMNFFLKKILVYEFVCFILLLFFFGGGWYLDFLSRVSCIKIDLFWFSIGFFIFTGFHCVVPVVALCISSHAFRLISLAVDRFWSRFVFRVFHRFWKRRWNQ